MFVAIYCGIFKLEDLFMRKSGGPLYRQIAESLHGTSDEFARYQISAYHEGNLIKIRCSGGRGIIPPRWRNAPTVCRLEITYACERSFNFRLNVWPGDHFSFHPSFSLRTLKLGGELDQRYLFKTNNSAVSRAFLKSTTVLDAITFLADRKYNILIQNKNIVATFISNIGFKVPYCFIERLQFPILSQTLDKLGQLAGESSASQY